MWLVLKIKGNDDATGFTIKDILPKNINFNYPSDIDFASLPAGVTHSYNVATRTLIFNIPDALVKKSLTPGDLLFDMKLV